MAWSPSGCMSDYEIIEREHKKQIRRKRTPFLFIVSQMIPQSLIWPLRLQAIVLFQIELFIFFHFFFSLFCSVVIFSLILYFNQFHLIYFVVCIIPSFLPSLLACLLPSFLSSFLHPFIHLSLVCFYCFILFFCRTSLSFG